MKCQATFSAKRDCPKCGSRLIAPTEAHVLPAEVTPFVPTSAGSSVAGRVAAGACVAVGLVLGFRDILGGMLPLIGETESWWATSLAFAVLLAAKSLAASGGGLLAGAGRTNAAVTGLLAGAVAGAAAAAIEACVPGGKVTFGLVLGAVLMAGCALGSGWVAGRIWPPQTELPKAALNHQGSSILAKAKDLQQEEDAKRIRPTQWVRVLLGVSLTVCGFVAADVIRFGLARGGAGLIDLGGARNVPFACLQIAIMIAVIGGVAAGASTGAGFRHGVFAGLIAGGLVAGIFLLRGPEKLPAAAGVAEVLDWSPDKTPPPRLATVLFGAEFLIASVAGLFGSILFPPVIARPRPGRALAGGPGVTTFG
jgi:hypothetical protein